VKPWRLLLLPPLFAACSTPTPYATTVGILKPGKTMTVRVENATVNAYQPAAGQRRDLFTVQATAPRESPPPPPRIRADKRGVTVTAAGGLGTLLVRVPDATDLTVDSKHGDINVTDITGNAQVTAGEGNVKLMLPGYAQGSVRHGSFSVTMGATQWPGTLRFSSGGGDVEVRISAKASFAVHLHTDTGTLYTDFGLRGTSNGASETIDGNVNGGGGHGIDVETTSGTIRLLKLQPQP
jgi:Putative adhesin